jgi:signal transduction histidine kinase
MIEARHISGSHSKVGPSTGHLMSLFLRTMRDAAGRPSSKLPALPDTHEERILRGASAVGDLHNVPNQKKPLPTALATVAEDLSTPLNMIAGAARSLKEECSPEDRDFWVDCILLHAVAAQNSVEDFKDKISEEAGSMEVRLDEINLSDVVREAVRDFVPLAHDHTLRFYGDDAWILGDAFRLQRLVFNLLSNATRHSDSGREIKVDVWRRGAHVCLFVQDQGCGAITNENECLFLPFRQLMPDQDVTQDIATDESWSLSSVRRIAEAHGATVKVQGIVGQGTIFEVCFKALDRPHR